MLRTSHRLAAEPAMSSTLVKSLALCALVALTFAGGFHLGHFTAEEEFLSRTAASATPAPDAAPASTRRRAPRPAVPVAWTSAPPSSEPEARRARLAHLGGAEAAAEEPALPAPAAALPVLPAPGYAPDAALANGATPPNVRDPRSRPWGLVVAADLRNVAAGMPVTASGGDPLCGGLAQITDGIKTCDDTGYVELAAGAQYVQVDLSRACRIDGIGLWHDCGNPRVYYAVQLWVSSTPEFQQAYEVFNNDQQNRLGNGAGRDELYLETHLGLLQAVPAVTGRYVRAYSRGNTVNGMNHYIELEVYGQPL